MSILFSQESNLWLILFKLAGEIITQISFSKPDFSNYEKFASQASKYAIVGVFSSLKKNLVKIWKIYFLILLKIIKIFLIL